MPDCFKTCLARIAAYFPLNFQRNFPLKVVKIALGLFLQSPAMALQITDDRGITVKFPASPRRIVSLLPSLTETVCALGQCKRLIAVDRYSNYPSSVQALPKVGGGLDPNIEAVVALRPDLVLLASSSRAIERLESLGITVLAFEPKTHDDVRRALQNLGALLEAGDAARVWQVIDASIRAAAQSLPEKARKSRVYFEVSPSPHGASESSFIGETLLRLGAANIVPGKLGPFPQLNPEFVVRADPDVVMVAERSFQGMAQRPGWGHMRAIREDRVCLFSPAQSDMLVRPGPRMAEAAALMAQCLIDKSR